MENISGPLLFLAFVVMLWLLLIRPAKKRQQEVARMQRELGVGSRIATVGGVFGDVVGEEGDDKLRVEVAPGVVLTIARQAVAGVVRPDGEVTDEPATEPATEAAEPENDERA